MSKTAPPGELQALLNANPALRRLARAARRSHDTHDDLGTQALNALPVALRQRVTLVEEAHRWLALVETSACAQMLRFHLPRLERALTAKSVKIVVTGRRGAPASQHPRSGPELDVESARHIREAAESIADEKLREALQRLAGRGEP